MRVIDKLLLWNLDVREKNFLSFIKIQLAISVSP